MPNKSHKPQNQAHKPAQRSFSGKITTTRKGVGYFDLPSKKREESIVIERADMKTALPGDIVEIEVLNKVNLNKQKCGKVTRIITRARQHFVGTVEIRDGKPFMIPDDFKVYVDFELRGKSDIPAVQTDDKVYVKLMSWNDPLSAPKADVIRILGKKGDNDVEMEAIVLSKGFETDFPENVRQETEKVEQKEKVISKEEIAKRRDMRNVLTFTIDPFDAKDFDDAVSFVELGPDLFEIGVHIADVSHYVREGNALDEEAKKRGCSIYLVDRTIPMLPHQLSNDICSLNPHEDKLSFSAVFKMDGSAKIVDAWFGRTVINSDHRFTYETAQAVMDNTPKNAEKYSHGIQTAASVESGMIYRQQLLTLNNIAKKLAVKKFAKGAIDFEQEEVKFKLDENGKPIGAYKYARLDTHKLVEEYMLLANREVAKFIFDSIKRKGKKNTGSIYRTHESPDKDKMKNLATFVKALGYTLRTEDGEVTAKDIKHLLSQVEDTPHEAMIRTATIRSMQKAIYSTKNVGHFGLAFDFYTHFTSPIRRYPDLLVHRILAKHLAGEPFKDTEINVFEKIAGTSTEREIDAAEAERASKKLKQVEYMSERVGKEYNGVISGVAKWGIYVEDEESKSEGMVPIGNLGSDYYVYNERNYSVTGERSGKKFSLGDKVKFKVVSADIDKRLIEYELVS